MATSRASAPAKTCVGELVSACRAAAMRGSRRAATNIQAAIRSFNRLMPQDDSSGLLWAQEEVGHDMRLAECFIIGFGSMPYGPCIVHDLFPKCIQNRPIDNIGSPRRQMRFCLLRGCFAAATIRFIGHKLKQVRQLSGDAAGTSGGEIDQHPIRFPLRQDPLVGSANKPISAQGADFPEVSDPDRKSTRLNSSHLGIS